MIESARQIPTFNLYGESQEWPTPDLLHWESVAQRSRLHNWVIKPHRHVNLLQFIYLRGGSARIQLDGKAFEPRLPCLVVIPPLSVHGFEFSSDVQGHVVTAALPLIRHLANQLDGSQNSLQSARVLPIARHQAPQLDQLLDALAREYNSNEVHRDWALQTWVGQLALWLARHREQPASQTAPNQKKSNSYFARFNELVENHYREHRPLAEYALDLGISSPHLNSVCRELAGRSALQLIHQRLLLEAKRNLIYTAMTVSEISHDLGFSEPAYFTRWRVAPGVSAHALTCS